MPTGYTAVLTEKEVTFKEFALYCARAFGALVTMREDPMDAPIPEAFEPSNYYREAVEKAEKELSKLRGFNEQERLDFGSQVRLEAIGWAEKCLANNQAENDKYDAMLAQVNAWVPPSSNHEEMKKFMAEQLKISKHDLKWSDAQLAKAKSVSAYGAFADALEKAERDVVYNRIEGEKEVERVRQRNLWVKQLRDSLKSESSTEAVAEKSV